jgi:hypothetical protein
MVSHRARLGKRAVNVALHGEVAYSTAPPYRDMGMALRAARMIY